MAPALVAPIGTSALAGGVPEEPRASLGDVPDRRLSDKESAGISLEEVTQQVLAEAVDLFVQPFEKLLAATQARRDEIVKSLSATS